MHLLVSLFINSETRSNSLIDINLVAKTNTTFWLASLLLERSHSALQWRHIVDCFIHSSASSEKQKPNVVGFDIIRQCDFDEFPPAFPLLLLLLPNTHTHTH